MVILTRAARPVFGQGMRRRVLREARANSRGPAEASGTRDSRRAFFSFFRCPYHFPSGVQKHPIFTLAQCGIISLLWKVRKAATGRKEEGSGGRFVCGRDGIQNLRNRRWYFGRVNEGQPANDERERAGLCSDCTHARRVESDRGAEFYLCGLSATDARFPKYPALPVIRCSGYAPED